MTTEAEMVGALWDNKGVLLSVGAAVAWTVRLNLLVRSMDQRIKYLEAWRYKQRKHREAEKSQMIQTLKRQGGSHD